MLRKSFDATKLLINKNLKNFSSTQILKKKIANSLTRRRER